MRNAEKVFFPGTYNSHCQSFLSLPYTLIQTVNYEKTIFVKENNLKSENDVRATYLHIQESSKRYSYNTVKISQYYRNIFKFFFSTLKDIIQSQNKTNHWISWNLIIICLKGISKECFLLSVNVNISLKSLQHSEGSQRAIRHLEFQRALVHSECSQKALGHLGT